MSRINLIILFLLIANLGFGQRAIKKTEVRENGFNVNIEYKPLVNQVSLNGLDIEITPVSPDSLNAQFLNENVFDGKLRYTHLENSRSSYFTRKQRKVKTKSDSEFLFEGANWLLENEKIDQGEYDKLVEEIASYFDPQTDSIRNVTGTLNYANPYYFDDKFLSVFRLTFANNSNTFKNFDNDIMVESGNQLQKPINDPELAQFVQNSALKIEAIKRHNLSLPIVVPPNSKIEKLFAIFPLDFNNNLLSMSIVGSPTKLKWKVEIDKNVFDERYKFYEFRMRYYCGESVASDDGFLFYLMKSKKSAAYIENNNTLLIDDRHLSDTIEIKTLYLEGNDLFFGVKDIVGSTLIDTQKNKRNIINISLGHLDELKRKVKK